METLTAPPVTLTERAVRDDGTITLKLIAPGQGSSGYYTREVLERDGPSAFKAGTHMYWDHPGVSEAAERPERSLRDLAARLVSDARWEDRGPEGPGLYAEAAVFSSYRPLVEEMGPHIGVSIRAQGDTSVGPLPDGGRGRIVERIASAASVDFVTQAGAGGRVLQLLEAARDGTPVDLVDKYVRADLSETTPVAPCVVCESRHHPKADSPKEEPMAEDTALRESVTKLEAQVAELTGNQKTLTEANTKLETDLTEAQDRAAKAEERLMLREAADHIAAAVAKVDGLPVPTAKRIVDTLSKNPPLTEAGALDTTKLDETIKTTVETEVRYLVESTGGRPVVTGVGGTSLGDPGDPEKTVDRLTSAFGRLGLTESAAKTAASLR